MIIESKDNKIIKYAKKLQDKKFSNNENKTLVESPKIIKELILQGLVESVIIQYDISDEIVINNSKIQKFLISKNIAQYLSQTETSTGIFAIVRIPKNATNIDYSRFLVLDNIQDPTNYGAICRSAVAFGYTTILDLNCTYAYSSKVTRCSMGNNFKLNIIKCNKEFVVDIKNNHNVDLICCDMLGKSIENSRPNREKFGIIIGNEGNGVSEFLRKNATQTVSIPMQNGVESLNASVSAGIIMFNLINKGEK